MTATVKSPEDLESTALGLRRRMLDPELSVWSPRRRYATACVLGVLAALLNLVAVPLLSEETPEFLFGGALVLLAFVALGAGPGLLAAAIAAIPQVALILPDVPALGVAYLVYPLEALLTYLFWRRAGSLVLGVSVFWLLIGAGWDALTYHQLVGLGWSYVVLLFIKQLLNGLLNALLVEIVLRLPSFWPRTARAVRLRQFVFSGLVAVVLAPGLLLAILFTRATYQRHLEVAQARSELTAAGVEMRLSEWLADRQHILARLSAELATADSDQLAARLRSRTPADIRVIDSPAGGDCAPWSGTLARGTIGLRRPLSPAAGCARLLEWSIPATELAPLLVGEPAEPGEGITLFDEHDHVLQSNDPLRSAGSAGAMLALPPEAVPDRPFTYYPAASPGTTGALDLDLRHGVLRRLVHSRWSVLVDLSSSSLHDAMTSSVAQLLLYFFALLALLYGAVSFFAARVTVPIVAINRAVQTIAAGQLEDGEPLAANRELADLAHHPVSEVQSLARHFDDMQRALVYRDMLTGLANRARFLDLLREAGDETGGVALFEVGVDRYRALFELLGRRSSELLLIAVSRRLQSLLGEDAIIARVAEHDFAILLRAVPDSAAAVGRTEEMLAALRRPFLVADRTLTLTASVGVLLHSGAIGPPEALLERARAAMRAAREQGGDGLCLFSAEIDQRLRERQTIEDALRRAIQRQETEVAFQPIVNIRDGSVRGLEALARWTSEPLASVGTERIIELAEDRDLIAAIDDAVLRAAALAYTTAFAGHTELILSVNISPRRLQRPDLAARVLETLAGCGLSPARLEIEITEAAVLLDFEKSLGSLRQLRAAGVRIALDDFGTGYSSLRYLRQLPLDTIKIDRSFVRDLGTAAGGASIAPAIVALAHSLGLEVVAEGVETEAQLEALRAEGCDFAQGFLISRPQRAEAVSELLASSARRA
jgi:diguanylate cyclase (GGDEF)-like protein